MLFHPTRRGVLGALAATGFAFDDVFAQPLTPTPQCHDGDEPTIRQSEGPYFKPSSPLRADLVEPNSSVRPVEVSGQVLTRSCQPVVRALLDFWHADERGEYDSAGFRYRGHLFTDAEGRYRLRTILPALYTGRTRHYHVKVQAPRQGVLTTQLYFPDEPMNRRDGSFHEILICCAEIRCAGRTYAAEARGRDRRRRRWQVPPCLPKRRQHRSETSLSR